MRILWIEFFITDDVIKSIYKEEFPQQKLIMSIQRDILQFPFDACDRCGEKHIGDECPNPNPFLEPEQDTYVFRATPIHDHDVPTMCKLRALQFKIKDWKERLKVETDPDEIEYGRGRVQIYENLLKKLIYN